MANPIARRIKAFSVERNEMDSGLDTLWRDTMRSLGFLTRLHVPSRYFEGDTGALTTAARAFPLAAIIATLPALAVLIVGTLFVLPPLLIAALAVATLTVTCGGLHEDGLADVADGFFGGNTSERRLEIMKDSRIGAYGALALVISFSVKIIALAAILQSGLLCALASLVAATVAGKAALIWHWSELESARPGGTSDKAGAPSEDAATFALGSGAAIAVILAFAARGTMPTLLAIGLCIVATHLFKQLCADKIGGQTGDTLGAAAIIAEMSFFIGLASGL